MTTTTMVEAEARYLIISPGQYGPEWGLTTLDPRVDAHYRISNRASSPFNWRSTRCGIFELSQRSNPEWDNRGFVPVCRCI